MIDQHYVLNEIAKIIAFEKIRVSKDLIDDRLITYILKAIKYDIRKQIIFIFI